MMNLYVLFDLKSCNYFYDCVIIKHPFLQEII